MLKCKTFLLPRFRGCETQHANSVTLLMAMVVFKFSIIGQKVLTASDDTVAAANRQRNSRQIPKAVRNGTGCPSKKDTLLWIDAHNCQSGQFWAWVTVDVVELVDSQSLYIALCKLVDMED